MPELLIGCGRARMKKLCEDNNSAWTELTTLDINEAHEPDVVWDLENLPLPFDACRFDEVHAYDVLEHTGRQGDWKFFFAQWDEFWRILKPGGVFFGISPMPLSPWAWGDPGHTRIIGKECLVYLDRNNYEQVGKSPMTDYRPWYNGDFEIIHSEYNKHGQHSYALRARKSHA